MEEASIIGIDLAKRSLQIHGAKADGSVAYRRMLLSFLAWQPKCTVVMEACAGAHYWGREIVALGHEVTALNTWANAHSCLWDVIAVVRTGEESDRTQAILRAPNERTGPKRGWRRPPCRTRPLRAGDPSGHPRSPRGVRGAPSHIEAQCRAREAGTLAARPGLDSPQQHLEIGAALQSQFSLSGPSVTPPMEGENDMGG